MGCHCDRRLHERPNSNGAGRACGDDVVVASGRSGRKRKKKVTCRGKVGASIGDRVYGKVLAGP